MTKNIFDTLKVYPGNSVSQPVISLSGQEALDFFMKAESYCTMELPEYFDLSGVLDYARKTVGDKSVEECRNTEGRSPSEMEGVNLDLIVNKDGGYGVRPLTLANPFLYYMLARDMCSEGAWAHIRECFRLYENAHFSACAIPVVRIGGKPDRFRGATSILNWWNSVEQASIEMSLKYRFVFITDITNCFGQVPPEAIGWALARKGTVCETDENARLATKMQQYLKDMQNGRNIGIPQGSNLFNFIAEIILGYADMLFATEIAEAQSRGDLPELLDYHVLRYVDDYRIFCNDHDALERISYILQSVLGRFNFRMNTSKTKVSTDLIADSVKPDKAFYIFNTPIVRKQRGLKEQIFDFAGFQKHLLFIYEFSRKFPNSGQLKNQLSALSERIEAQLSRKTEIKVQTINLGDLVTGTREDADTEVLTEEVQGHFWENIPPMVAIAVQIAADNVSVAHYALKVASQMLEDMPKEQHPKKMDVIELIYKKLRYLPNSAFLQLWLQNITHSTDDWSKGDRYDMPLCKLVAMRSENLWNNSWLKTEIAEGLPVESIVDREALSQTGQVITFKERCQYDEALCEE